MAVEVGKVAYLLLAESFDRPRWRQALVVKVDKEWIQVLVRAKQKREVLNHFTCLDYDGKTYFLVELLTHQLRAFYEEPCLDLMAEAENLVDAASQLLVSDSEIVFATASEPEPPALTSRPRRKKVERPPSPSNSSSGEGSDFTDVMEKLRKNWQGEATSGEKVRDQEKGSKHEKFPLLTKDKTKKEKDFMESFPRDLLSGLKQGGDPVQALLTPPACRKAGKSGSKEAQVPTQIKEQFKEFEPYGFRVRPKSGPKTQGPCQRHPNLSGHQETHAERSNQTRSQICEGGGRRTRNRWWQAIQAPRCGASDILGETEKPSKSPLLAIRDPHAPPEEEERGSGTSSGAIIAGGSPGSPRPGRLISGMDVDPLTECVGQTPVRRHSRRTRQCSGLPQVPGRIVQERSKSKEFKSRELGWSRRRDFGCQRRAEGKERRWKRETQERRRNPRELKHENLQQSAKPGCSNSIVRLLMSGHGSFSRFLRLLQSKPYVDGSGPRTSSEQTLGNCKLFPSLLVVPIQHEPPSSRRRRRGRGREYTWEYTRVIWALFTFLEAGSPYKESDQVSLANRALSASWTAAHASYAGSLHDQIHRFCRLRMPDSLGRGLDQLNKLVTSIKNSEYKPGPFNIEELASAARSVKPDRMSLPEQAGIIDPLDHLRGEQRQEFENMIHTVPHDEPPEVPTKGCFKVAPKDIQPVYKKLLDSKVAVLMPEEFALRDSTGRIITGGLFAVPHKESSDRIICDRRPLNELERRLVWAKLPHGSLLTQIVVPPGFSIRGSGDDLSNYFYLLKHQESWLHRNMIGKPVSGSLFTEYGCDKNKKYVLSFRVIPMGDLNAVDIAQQTHVEILKDAGCMSPNHVLSFKEPLPASHTLEGLYIDDHVVMQIVPGRKLRPRDLEFEDEKLVRASRQYYEHLGIPVSVKKAYTKQSCFQAWGTSVDSVTGRVGTPLCKLRQLATLVGEVCQLKHVGKKLLQKTLGLFVHPCMHQRILMSLLEDSYAWVEKLEDHQPRRLPASVKEELLTLSLCLPLCHANIKWQVSTRVGASDASLTGGGRAATPTTPTIAQTLFRYSNHQGEHVRLDWEKGAVAPPTTMTRAPSELEDIMEAHTWNTTHRCTFAHRQHINILEMKMIKAELVGLVNEFHDPCRAVLLVDSRVAAGAWGKGRSSSRQLNRLLKSMIGWSIAGRKSLHLIWVQSAKNPADFPSRSKPIPPPKDDSILRTIFGDDVPDVQTRRSNRKLRLIAKSDIVSGGLQRCNAEGFKADIGCLNQTRGHLAQKHWSFREIFAGSGHLTQAFKDHGMFRVGQPVELFQRGRPDSNHDLLNDRTFNMLIEQAKKSHQIWHFGLPCSSFSLMQHMNKGTRSIQNPRGNGKLHREIVGNRLADRTIRLCHVLSDHHNFFTIENPQTSYAWHLPNMQKLLSSTGSAKIDFDQCMFNLKIPGTDGVLGLAKKCTSFAGNLPGLKHLKRRCTGSHSHVQVIGGVKTKEGWQRRSTLAGRYPKQLCSAYLQICNNLFA